MIISQSSISTLQFEQDFIPAPKTQLSFSSFSTLSRISIPPSIPHKAHIISLMQTYIALLALLTLISLALTSPIRIVEDSPTIPTPLSPSFPTSFSTQIEFVGQQRHYSWDFYMDSDLRQYRIDSYGIPLANRTSSNAQALYLFYYVYDENMLFSFMPQVLDDTYTCKMHRTPKFKAFPSLVNTGILDTMTYVGQVDTPTTKGADYWTVDFGGFFSFDLMLNHESQVPVKLSVSSDDMFFEKFNATRPGANIWQFPNHTACALAEELSAEEKALLPEEFAKW